MNASVHHTFLARAPTQNASGHSSSNSSSSLCSQKSSMLSVVVAANVTLLPGMRLLPGRAFNSMGSDYAEGDLVLHAGGGGAFGLHIFGKDKYVELLRRCQILEGDLALHSKTI